MDEPNLPLEVLNRVDGRFRAVLAQQALRSRIADAGWQPLAIDLRRLATIPRRKRRRKQIR